MMPAPASPKAICYHYYYYSYLHRRRRRHRHHHRYRYGYYPHELLQLFVCEVVLDQAGPGVTEGDQLTDILSHHRLIIIVIIIIIIIIY